jgi:hypothetical protein
LASFSQLSPISNAIGDDVTILLQEGIGVHGERSRR